MNRSKPFGAIRSGARPFICADCQHEKPGTAKRQVVREDNPRAEVCQTCARRAA